VKKAIICTFVFLLFVSFAAYAYQAPEINVTDVNGDVITVSGVAESDVLPVSLVILNPGYTKESLSDGNYTVNSNAIQTFKATYPIKGNYSFDVSMKDTTSGEGGGIYTVYITEGETEYEPISYRFYFQGVKLNVINTLNLTQDITPEQIADAYIKYGLENYELYKKGNPEKISEALELIRSEIPSKKFSTDTALFDTILKKAALLGAYNASKTDIITGSDGYIKYDDIMGITALSSWNDYKNSLNKKGVSSLNKDLISGNYTSIEEINEKLRELVAYYGIICYKDGGFGHFDYFFNEYDDIYKKYNFDISSVKSAKKNKVYKDVLDTNTSNIGQLADKFNEIVEESNSKQSGSSSGGGGGGGGVSVGSGTAVAPNVPKDSYIVPEIEFHDLSGAEWARSAVMYLAEKGVVSGKAKNVFAPSDLVTRGEFLKMLTCALSLSATGSVSGFEDVKGHWAEKYISAAVEAGIAHGVSDTSFAPDLTITREMGASFIIRGLEFKNMNTEPDTNIFADDNDISDYAKDSVYGLKNTGIMSGVGDNRFNPKGNMTRAEAARAIYALMIYTEEVGK